jgi:hypothetical protein
MFQEWNKTYYKASTALQYRERKLEDAANLIENNLILLGATAIEDKLQDQVSHLKYQGLVMINLIVIAVAILVTVTVIKIMPLELRTQIPSTCCETLHTCSMYRFSHV